jgi:hypothetical protein
MDDLTKRLREACCDPEAVCHDCALHREAADRIETLAAKCEALEEALAAKSRPLDPRMKAAIQEGYNAEAVALEKQVSEALAARVRSLEEAGAKMMQAVHVMRLSPIGITCDLHDAVKEFAAALTREEGKT